MGKGTSESTNQTQQDTTTSPWAPAVPAVTSMLGQIHGLANNNTALSPAQTDAFGQLVQQGQQGNPYAGAIGNATNTMLGGGGPDRTGMATDAYNNYQQQVSPMAGASAGDPSKNPALAQMLATIQGDVGNSVNSMFAGAGRDLSGANQMAYGRGIAQGFAPAMMQAQQMGLDTSKNLYNAGNTTTGVLSGLDQTRLGNMATGAAMAPAALAAQQWGPQQVIGATEAMKNMPGQDLMPYASMLGQYAGLGGQQHGTGQTIGSQTMSPAQQAWGWMNASGNLMKNIWGGGGGGGGGGGSAASGMSSMFGG